MSFWDSAAGIIVGVALGLVALGGLIFSVMYGVAEWNKHNAPLAAAVCAKACGPAGVHHYTTDYGCECNETKRFEGSPSLDLNITNKERK